jgi:hypothetical protein
MTMVMRTPYAPAVRNVGMPRGAAGRMAERRVDTRSLVEDGYRHQAIGGLQALGLAITASLVVTGLLWTML